MRVGAVEPGYTRSELGGEITHPRSREVLEGFGSIPPIPADVLAGVIATAVALPPEVNLAELVVVPTRQG